MIQADIRKYCDAHCTLHTIETDFRKQKKKQRNDQSHAHLFESLQMLFISEYSLVTSFVTISKPLIHLPENKMRNPHSIQIQI